MKRSFAAAILVLLWTACSRLPPLTADILSQAEQKWSSHKPAHYRLVVEMSGDRVQTGRFEVEVRGTQIVTLRHDGLIVRPNPGQDYTMEGLFQMLMLELGLVERPSMLGAPEGYSVYATAKFDDATGRLIRYRRIVGGASNSIDVRVVEYQVM